MRRLFEMATRWCSGRDRQQLLVARRRAACLLTAFPDYHAEILEVVAEGDRVVARVQFTGTNDGPYEGRPPTHNKLSFSTADFFRIDCGKIAEHWDVVNVLPRMIALGQIQPPVSAPKAPENPTAKPR